MNLSSAPNSPIRTPQPRSSSKSLQLTPIWEEVVKNNRLPPDVNQDLIFKEIAVRLEDLESPVRQHAFRVLYDIIPILSKERLDERIIQNNILGKLVINLGHPAPGVRKIAAETIQKYLKRTSQSERMLEDFIQYGVKEKDLVNNDQAGILRENITLGTIVTLLDVLKPFIIPENGGFAISQAFLTDIVEALASKTKIQVYRDKALETLWKLKEMVGENRFYNILDKLSERENIFDLLNVNGRMDNFWSDEKSEKAFGVLTGVQDSFEFPPTGEKKEEEKNSSSEDYSDGTDTETYTKEPAPILDDEAVFYQMNRLEVSSYIPPSFVPIDVEDRKDIKEEGKDSTPTSPRVVLQAEIQFAKNKAITMKVVEDENNAERDAEVEQFRNEEIDDEKMRTPRRVRFGGEVIKLRTPDSDTTDITIEIHEADEPVIKITPESVKDKEEEEEGRSHIPLPLVPVTKPPSREPSPLRRPSSLKVPKDDHLSSKQETYDSAPSSSGSEGDVKEKEGDEKEESFWQWSELRMVEENILKDLKNTENWKIQYQALEQLKIVLISPKTIERIGKMKNHEKLNSLFKCLLHKMPQSNNQQVTTLALSVVSQLIETLPKEIILLDVEDIVRGLCKYVGGCKNLNLKIEAVQSLKMLFGILEPSAVIDVLIGEDCLFSSNSKLRENSLLAIMYATMTFPSDMFDTDKILEKVATSVADMRRRVRHAALEAIAILSQYCASQTLTDNIARVAERLSTPTAKAQLIAAVQARLSRRLLPSISSEGLVLYALQIPASRRFGNLGNPMGADVDWILSGTGSMSTGSAKSRTQLNAAQRLDSKPSLPLSPNKWSQSERIAKVQPSPTNQAKNPWTIQKNRTEFLPKKTPSPKTRFYKTQSAGNLNGENLKFPNFFNPEKRIRPEDITWALVPVSALDESVLGRERSNSLWGESVGDTPHLLSTSFGNLRPMYLKLQPSQEQFVLSRSSDDVRRNSYSFGGRDDEDFNEVRLLTPTILREKYVPANYYQNGKQRNETRSSNETPTRIPVLCTTAPKTVQRQTRLNTSCANDRKLVESEDTNGNQKPARLNSYSNGYSASSVFLPSIHPGQNDSYNSQKSPTSNKFTEVDETKLQDTMTQLSGLLNASKGIEKSGNRYFYPGKNQPEVEVKKNETAEVNDTILEDKIENKLFNRSYLKNRDLPNTIASAPPIITSDTGDQAPSTSSSNSTDFGTLSGSEFRIRKLTSSGALEGSTDLLYNNYGTYNAKLKGKKTFVTKASNKVGTKGNQFPESLKPFERPKEGLDTCFNQLESQQWEVNMLGLTSLVRLVRHHPAMVLSQLHPIIVTLGRQIKNLRSQVARAACQASAEMFLALKRNLEPELEEISGPLFHRSADTNRFIRADCNNALDNMVDNVGHARAVSVIISKGTTHQNATVRAVAARLLLRLSERAGPEKILSLPKENRDKMLQAGANLLMEGKLETRAFAKQVFRVWSSHPPFSALIQEAVEPNTMRHISKTLVSLKS